MSANNLCIRLTDAAIRWYRTRHNGHCLYLALFEPFGQQLSDAQIWAARRLLSDRVRAMSSLPHQSGQPIAVQIRQEHNESLDEYCLRTATTGAFGSTVEAEAFVKEKDGELSVRIWTKETFEGHGVLREMLHIKGNDDASVVELLWTNGGDAATGTDGRDHYERFDFQRVRRPPSPIPTPSLIRAQPLPPTPILDLAARGLQWRASGSSTRRMRMKQSASASSQPSTCGGSASRCQQVPSRAAGAVWQACRSLGLAPSSGPGTPGLECPVAPWGGCRRSAARASHSRRFRRPQ
jgi:hypothetical protein